MPIVKVAKRTPRERSVESYLRQEVHRAGGIARKLKGKKNETDRIILWPHGRTDFVELKRLKQKPNAGQKREHVRLSEMGYQVFVIDSKDKVDSFIWHRS